MQTGFADVLRRCSLASSISTSFSLSLMARVVQSMVCTADELGAAYLALGCAARDVEREVYGMLVLGCAPRSL